MATEFYASTSAAAHSLACLSMEKQAVRAVTEKQAKDDWVKNLTEWAKANPEIAGSLLGAGGGGLFGAVSSLGKDEEDRNTLGSALTGAMSGGLLGAGGGLAYRYRDALQDATTGGKKSPPKSWDEGIQGSIESGDLPKARDPGTPLTLEEHTTGNHGKTPAEMLDMQNRLKGYDTNEVHAALEAGEISEAEFRLWSKMQTMPGKRKEPSWISKMTGEAPLPNKGEFKEPTYANDPAAIGMSGEELTGYRKRQLKDRQKTFDEGMPSSYDVPTALMGVPLDIGHSRLRRKMEQGNMANPQQGAKSLLNDLREGGATVSNPSMDAKKPPTPEARQTTGQANQYRWMSNPANQQGLSTAMGEARKGVAGSGVNTILKDTHPQFFPQKGQPPLTPELQQAMRTEQSALMKQLSTAARQGRADLGGYVGSLESATGKMPRPHVKAPMNVPGAKGSWLGKPLGKGRMLGRGLLYGLAPMAIGRMRRQGYKYEPANYEPPKLPGGK